MTYEELYSKINLEKIFDYYDIEYKIAHNAKGVQFTCCCPFYDHDDSTPSFGMNKDTGIFNCFSKCGGGNFVKFVQKMERLGSYREAHLFIEKNIGGEKKSEFEVLKDRLNKISSPIPKQTVEEKEVVLIDYPLPESDPAEKHLNIVGKRVSLQTIQKWKMKYCIKDGIYRGKCDGRLIMPVYFEGKIATFGARDMTGRAEQWIKMKNEAKENGATKEDLKKLSAKYLYKKIWYPWKTPMNHIFFNWDNVKKGDEVIICEGILSCVRVANFGYNALAILSCQLSDYKSSLLIKNFNTIFIALDNDDKIDSNGNQYNPGQTAAQKIIEDKLNTGVVEVFNIVLPTGKDPDDCTKEEFDACFEASRRKTLTF